MVVAAALLLPASAGSAGLSGAPRLRAIYDFILDARFDRADALLNEKCQPAPEEACLDLKVVSTWWQVLIDPENRQLDARLTQQASSAIEAGDAWTKREPQRAEAWFYLAGAYAPLVQWRVLRGKRLAAARDGKTIKDALERALQLDPKMDDAFFGIGLYHYYADVAPVAAKILRWLLLLPGGNRVEGLREIEQARERGVLLAGEADFQLHQIDLWYERKPLEAIALLQSLDAKYPNNPIFLERIADAHETWLHDRASSASAWRTLLDRARAGGVHDAPRAETRAHLALNRLAAR